MTRNLIWKDAGLECQSLHEDAHLLIIDDAEEQKGIAQMLDSADSQCLCFPSSVLSEFTLIRRLQQNNSLVYHSCEVFCLIHLLGAGLAQTS